MTTDIEAARKEAMEWLKSGATQAQVARRYGVSRQTALRWAKRVEEGVGATSDRPGPKPKLNAQTQAEFSQKIAVLQKQGVVITLESARALLKREFKIVMSRAQLARVLATSESPTNRQRQYKANDEIPILKNWADAQWKF